ncbi:inorganic phosphate transporter [Jongsikchunia kroppenstedtii]|uniref:inorganic phosphate transporter n=1 Tax=Jongsikchunia kroppenstedtii TaxID=1121721 RepID=UPI00035DC1DB|nr:inorganic phosphate transporter [Jongsikchunia kroppenstedtii]
MSNELVILLLVIVTALAFDFTNGFHDTGNAMATSIATGALKPKTAVALSAILNLVGAFLSVSVALTVTNSVIKIQQSSGSSQGAPVDSMVADHGHALLIIVFAGLIGGIVWNLLTWLLGLPSSSSHALFGGLIGSAIAALGMSGVVWNGDGKLDGVVGKVILPALISPFIAGIVAGIGTWLVYKLVAGVATKFTEQGFRWGQIGTSSLLSLAHGTNDAQKTMGVITLAVIAYSWDDKSASGPFAWHDLHGIPLWVKVACACAIALGTYVGGWRVIRTLGKGLVEISPPQGMSAEAASATVVLASTGMGFALSTTHVATGSILGSGVGKPGASVRWRVAARLVAAWVVTLPAAAVVGAIMWEIGDRIPDAGPYVMFAILLALAGYMYWRAQQQPVDATNVNDDWDDKSAPAPPADSRALDEKEAV